MPLLTVGTRRAITTAFANPGATSDFLRLIGLLESTGPAYYVHATDGSNAAGAGLHPDSPYASVAYALNNMPTSAASKGAVIFCLPGHTETLSAAAGWDVDTAGVSIIGLGAGSLRPQITMGTAATVDIDIDAANVTIENVDFIANVADIVAAIDVNADHFTIRNCRFIEATNLNFLICIQDAAAGGSDYMTIDGCRAHCPDAANTHFVNFAGTGTGHTVTNNILIGDWGTMAIGGAGVVTNVYCCDNQISNAATDNDSCINFAATATGICDRNLCSGGAAQANGITATGMSQNLNYYGVVSEDLQGILDPIVT